MKFQLNNSPVIEIAPSVMEQIRGLAIESTGHETGGILVGFNQGRDIIITEVSDAGPKAETSRHHFLRDTDYCRGFLTERYKETGADYVGEWHSHVVSLHRLSGGDLNTLAGIFIDPDYDFSSFAVVLVVMHRKEPDFHVYVAERESRPGIHGLHITELYRGPFPDSGEGP